MAPGIAVSSKRRSRRKFKAKRTGTAAHHFPNFWTEVVGRYGPRLAMRHLPRSRTRAAAISEMVNG
jgi:hypothetical protein